MIFELDTASQLVTVSGEMTLTDLQKRLEPDSLMFPYQPLGKTSEPLKKHIKELTPNLFHLSYKTLADRVATLEYNPTKGAQFCLPQAPRASLGPDFNRLVMGDTVYSGTVNTLCLKLVSKPQKTIDVFLKTDSLKKAQQVASTLLAKSCPPLLALYTNQETLTELCEGLNKDPGLWVRFCGVTEIVQAKLSVLKTVCASQKLTVTKLSSTGDESFLDGWISQDRSAEQTESIAKQYAHFF